MTIEKMYNQVKENVQKIQEIGWKNRENELFKNRLKHYEDLGAFMNRRSMPRKSEVERIYKMSFVALKKAQAFA